MDLDSLSVEEVAWQYLQEKERAKDLKKKLEGMQDNLSRRLGNGDRLNVRGVLYEWVVSKTPTTKYKSLLDWLHGEVSADVQVLIEEGRGLADVQGSRTSKELKQVT